MTDDLRKRGFDVLGKLIKTKSAEALPDERAWKREFITAFPQDEPLGVLTTKEADWSELETRKMDPDFTLADRSTMLVDDNSLAATVFTHAVRLHRLQPREGIGHAAETSRKPFTFWTDAVKAYSTRVIDIRAVKGRAPTEAEDMVWAKGHDMARTRLRWLRKNCPERTAKDRRIGNPAKK